MTHDRSLDFISTLARFYLDPMCEINVINSKGPDPLGPLQGTRFQRGPKGASSPWILSHSNFWILFLSYLRILMPTGNDAKMTSKWLIILFQVFIATIRGDDAPLTCRRVLQVTQPPASFNAKIMVSGCSPCIRCSGRYLGWTRRAVLSCWRSVKR